MKVIFAVVKQKAQKNIWGHIIGQYVGSTVILISVLALPVLYSSLSVLIWNAIPTFISISTSSLKHVANNSSIQQPMFGLSCIYCCLVVDFLLYPVLFVPHRWRPMFWLSVLWDLSHANMQTWVVQPRYNVDHTDTFCHVCISDSF